MTPSERRRRRGVPYHHELGKAYDAARLGREFAEDLPEDKVV